MMRREREVLSALVRLRESLRQTRFTARASPRPAILTALHEADAALIHLEGLLSDELRAAPWSPVDVSGFRRPGE